MAIDLRARYGPWALIAGASVGMGAEFATQIASWGLNVILIARRAELLDTLAREITAAHGVQTRCLSIDLADPDAATLIVEQTSDLEIGLFVYNAAFSAVGPFFERPLADHLREIETNCQTPLALTYLLGKQMLARKRGGIVLLSSLSALQGTALISNYTATKAYNLILAEGLWEELRREGIDVPASLPGATSTPNYNSSTDRHSAPRATPQVVVAQTLAALGKGPNVVPTYANKLSAFAMQHLMPRKMAIAIMGRVLRGMYAR